MKELFNVIYSPLSRMNVVNRYSNIHLEEPELLSNHASEACSMSYVIASKMIYDYDESLDKGLLLEKALLHDVDEVFTGDIVRSTKYSSGELHENFNKLTDKVITNMEHEIFGDIVNCDFKDLVLSSKEGKEGYIVRIVDMFCVVKKTLTEVILRNNLDFLRVVTNLSKYLDSTILNNQKAMKDLGYNKKSIDYMLRLILEASTEIRNILTKYKDIIETFGLKE